MELNNLQLCFALWIVAELVSIIVTWIHKGSINRAIKAKELYFSRLIYFMKKGTPISEILQELYFSFSTNSGLRSILFKAMNQARTSDGLKLITESMQCRPITLVHRQLSQAYLMGQETIDAKDNLYEYFTNELEIWKESRREAERILRKKRRRYFIEKTIFLISNLALYFYLKNEKSLGIFIVVNTIGVILFIVLDYDCTVVDSKIRDGKLAKIKKPTKKALEPARRLQGIFQMVASLGLILNITMIAARLLDGAI